MKNKGIYISIALTVGLISIVFFTRKKEERKPIEKKEAINNAISKIKQMT